MESQKRRFLLETNPGRFFEIFAKKELKAPEIKELLSGMFGKEFVNYIIDASPATNKHLEILSTLKIAGCNLTVKQDTKVKVEDQEQNLYVINLLQVSLLHLAARNNDVETAKFLIEECKVSVDIADTYGRTPLHEACGMCNLEVVNFLIKSSADVCKAITDDYHFMPIDLAIKASRSVVGDRVIKSLIEKAGELGVLSDVDNKMIEHALLYGCLYGNSFAINEIIKYRDENGKRYCNSQKLNKIFDNANGKNALHYACTMAEANNAATNILLLLKYGANPLAKTEKAKKSVAIIRGTADLDSEIKDNKVTIKDNAAEKDKRNALIEKLQENEPEQLPIDLISQDKRAAFIKIFKISEKRYELTEKIQNGKGNIFTKVHKFFYDIKFEIESANVKRNIKKIENGTYKPKPVRVKNQIVANGMSVQNNQLAKLANGNKPSRSDSLSSISTFASSSSEASQNDLASNNGDKAAKSSSGYSSNESTEKTALEIKPTTTSAGNLSNSLSDKTKNDARDIAKSLPAGTINPTSQKNDDQTKRDKSFPSLCSKDGKRSEKMMKIT